MKSSLQQKFDRHTAAFDWERAMSATTFADFDDAVTAPLHGFDGMNDYYDRCSSVHYLKAIEKPTLVINALDDPFMTPGVIPHQDRLSASVSIEVSEHGGHVGFIDGGTPWKPRFYLPGRITTFLEPHLAVQGL
jgi:predicted alpha/beta-fold hydrolase